MIIRLLGYLLRFQGCGLVLLSVLILGGMVIVGAVFGHPANCSLCYVGTN